MDKSKTRTIEVVPSYPADSFSSLRTVLEKLKHVAAGFQVDLVDGEFVSATPSWPYLNDREQLHEELLKLKDFSVDYELEIDCMIKNPSTIFDTLKQLGAKRLVLHFGSSSQLLEDIIEAKNKGFLVSLGVCNDTKYTDYGPLLDRVQGVQVMGIATIGKQGQPFDERTIGTIQNLKTHHQELAIAVDGSVNESTVPKLLEAGATRLAPGSAIVKAADPKKAYQELLMLSISQQ